MSVLRWAAVAATLALTTASIAGCGSAPIGGPPEDALMRATTAHDAAAVEKELASGANPNKMVPCEGLYHSAWEWILNNQRPKRPEDLEIIKAMLKHGANPMSAWGEGTAKGITRRRDTEPLLLVMLHPNAGAVRALLDAGMRSGFGEFALVNAIETGETEIARMLVESGVNVNGSHSAALTPLVAAIEARDFKMMVYLEEHGAREKP
jgi:ankyrin repeat protein